MDFSPIRYIPEAARYAILGLGNAQAQQVFGTKKRSVMALQGPDVPVSPEHQAGQQTQQSQEEEQHRRTGTLPTSKQPDQQRPSGLGCHPGFKHPVHQQSAE